MSKAQTPVEILQAFLTANNLSLQVNAQRPQVRYMEDGGLVLDPPKFTIGVTEVKPSKGVNGKDKIETN